MNNKMSQQQKQERIKELTIVFDYIKKIKEERKIGLEHDRLNSFEKFKYSIVELPRECGKLKLHHDINPHWQGIELVISHDYDDYIKHNYEKLNNILEYQYRCVNCYTNCCFVIPIFKIPKFIKFFGLTDPNRSSIFVIYNSSTKKCISYGRVLRINDPNTPRNCAFIGDQKYRFDVVGVSELLSFLIKHHNEQLKQDLGIKQLIQTNQQKIKTLQRLETELTQIKSYIQNSNQQLIKTVKKDNETSLQSVGTFISNIQQKLIDLEEYTGRIKLLLDEHIRESQKNKQSSSRELRQYVLKELKNSKSTIKLLQQKIKLLSKPKYQQPKWQSKRYNVDKQTGEFIP